MHPSDFQNLFLMGFVFMNIGDNGWGMAAVPFQSVGVIGMQNMRA